MFSGIVEETGEIKNFIFRPGGMSVTIAAQKVLRDTAIGDSIAVNGVCLTVVRCDSETFEVDMAPETLRKTSLGKLQKGQKVNLERALPAQGRIGGHVVQGHIDATGEVVDLQPDGEGMIATFSAPVALMKYIVSKGYIAIDGMSLTIVDTGPDRFTISLIPHTRAVTTAAEYAKGTQVNLEVDILGKYIEKLLASSIGQPPTRL